MASSSLMARVRALVDTGVLQLGRPSHLQELERVDGRLLVGILGLAKALAPSVTLLVTSVLRDANQHREGRAIDLAFRVAGLRVPAQRGLDPRYNESKEMALALMHVMNHMREDFRGLGVPGIVIESDHIHLMVGDGVENEVWTYQGDTTYTSDSRFSELLPLAGLGSKFPNPLRPARLLV